ncbi:transcription termination factor 1, mitochondrial [Carcharodon carcharias]|uniref:transcription termination factor 1, mitochondrial n=1 Tax=Carcharodon carcharias TaxID=13397 RepID=UPI001B7EB659|nr:transcription termination factor 1, mitochondrial [Carcharodon carcharias]XP_041041118.1 transcription termination factor 1, mitochondrial [Carcharodon carcharias]XP_041041119.1 transcription termination factor 1, mitochondrial [Carcharodon carcharias]XP_041041120.1 transcription termination factor 1, mitochondrial [Carcharodon carcharias]XP_041041121.1 transcription termination factor 1, mitochondrial [Carcharodon carcharias]XP_041041122.1 transcription termination factor 1, mitochondrial 
MAARMVAQVMQMYLWRTRFPDLPNYFASALGFCTSSHNDSTEIIQKPENSALLNNLTVLGVDIKMARRRQPAVLRKVVTNEEGVAEFLRSKGANCTTIASIISRYPRAITRSHWHLEEKWQLWRSIFKTDSEVISVIERSPESYFRSSDNGNLEKNINFLCSLGLSSKDLHRILTTAPRTFSNSLELNKQMVKLLHDLGVRLDYENPDTFVKRIITKNAYILIRSTKRIKTNVDFFTEALKLSNSELIKLLQGHGAEILDLSSDYMKRNFKNISEQLQLLGCTAEEVKKFFLDYPPAFYASFEKLSNKINCLLESGINIKQLLKKPRILEFSANNLKNRIEELERVGYDFKNHGITILDSSRRRFEAKLEKLNEEG